MDQALIIAVIVAQVAYSIYASAKLRALRASVPERSDLLIAEEEAAVAEGEADSSEQAEEPKVLERQDDETQFEYEHRFELMARQRSSNRAKLQAARSREKSTISEIRVRQNLSDTFRSIVFDLNEYALKNRGSASDFAIVKDVVDRPIDALIDHAESRASTPLYLGLAGALIGIIVGLYTMSNSIGLNGNADDAMSALTGNLGKLLGSVSFAMIASLLGVVLTIALTTATRHVVARVDDRRNGFFTFYQIEFLPRITRDVNSVLASLNGTLDKFNRQFGGNVEAMQSSFSQNKSAIEEQQKVLEAMRQLSVGGALEGTIDLYKSVNEASKSLDKLTPHIERVHYMIAEVGKSGERFAKVANNVENVEATIVSLKAAVEATNEVQGWASRHLTQLDDTSKAANQVSHTIVSSFEESQRKILAHLVPLTETFRSMIQTLETTTTGVISGAQESINLIPTQIEPLMREAFDAKTVLTIANSADRAATAAREAQQELTQSKLLRGEVETGIKAQAQTLKQITSTLNSLQRRNDANSEAVYTLLERRPWWWMLPSKRKALPPELPNKAS